MEAFKTSVLSFLVPLLFVGCASVKTGQEWRRFQDIARERMDQELLWEKSEKEQASIRKEIEKLLADGLSRQESVRIALFNNRLLQSTFEELGISKSDLVQAGLFSNPTVGAVFRFLISGGSGTNIDADGFLPISDLWQIPFRKKAAAARMEATIMHVGQMVLDTAAEAKRAFDAVYYLNEERKETEEILRRFKEIADQVVIRRDFGFGSDLDIYLAQAMVAEVEMEVARLEREQAIAKSHLNRVMGLGLGRVGYEIIGGEGGKSVRVPSLDEAIEYALEHRLDIQMARFKIRQAEKELELGKSRILKHVALGASYERDPDDDEVFGPGFDIQLPIFDQNQAQIAKARYRIRQARKSLQALEGSVREDVTSDLERIHLHQTRVHQFREKIIPLREKALEYSERWVKAMQLNRLYLLEAQKGLLQSRREYLRALMERQQALVDLELHMGGKVSQVY
ncbi:MAG: TolC family protein [Proteobacteria bacterium]|nr:TolC family protein [Pseudomonadota bacterium]NIS67565.1 TolC family protein [Pseudomonadota bacterium]